MTQLFTLKFYYVLTQLLFKQHNIGMRSSNDVIPFSFSFSIICQISRLAAQYTETDIF